MKLNKQPSDLIGPPISGNRIVKRVLDRKNISFLVVVDLLFIFSPLASILFQILLLLSIKFKYKWLFVNYILCISFFLGLLNTTKVVESDMINYLYWFDLVPSMDFIEYIKWFGKEPLYYVFVYIISVISGGSHNVFIITVTFTGYFIVLYALLRISLALNLSKLVVVALLVGVSFLPQLFSISLHLTRQFLATSLLMLFLSIWIVDGKKTWYVLFIAFFFHSVIISLLPFLLIPKLRQDSTIKMFVWCAISLLSVFSLLPFIAVLFSFSGVDFLMYVGTRVTQVKYHILSPPGIPVYMMILLGCSLYLYNLKKNKINILTRPETKEGYHITCSLFIIVSLIIVIAGMSEDTYELAGRYTFFLYYFVPIIALFSSWRNSLSKFSSIAIIVLLPLYFVYKLEFGIWTYINYIDVLLYPIVFI